MADLFNGTDLTGWEQWNRNGGTRFSVVSTNTRYTSGGDTDYSTLFTTSKYGPNVSGVDVEIVIICRWRSDTSPGQALNARNASFLLSPHTSTDDPGGDGYWTEGTNPGNPNPRARISLEIQFMQGGTGDLLPLGNGFAWNTEVTSPPVTDNTGSDGHGGSGTWNYRGGWRYEPGGTAKEMHGDVGPPTSSTDSHLHCQGWDGTFNNNLDEYGPTRNRSVEYEDTTGISYPSNPPNPGPWNTIRFVWRTDASYELYVNEATAPNSGLCSAGTNLRYNVGETNTSNIVTPFTDAYIGLHGETRGFEVQQVSVNELSAPAGELTKGRSRIAG